MGDELIRLDTTIIGIDSLINKAPTAEEAKVLFTAKGVIYSQQRFVMDVQPVKRGRWLPAKGWFMSKCSECGYEIGTVLAAKYICCPKCTARMDGDTNE